MAVKLGDAGELLWWQRSKFISVIKSWVIVVGVLSDLLGLKHGNARRGNFAAKLCAPEHVLRVTSSRNSDFCMIADRPKVMLRKRSSSYYRRPPFRMSRIFFSFSRRYERISGCVHIFLLS